MGSLGLLLYWIFLVRATTAMSAIITIVKDLPIFSFQHLPSQSFLFIRECVHRAKMCELKSA